MNTTRAPVWVKWAMRLTPPKMMKPSTAATNACVAAFSRRHAARRRADADGADADDADADDADTAVGFDDASDDVA